MIYTVTFNPALDYVIALDRLSVGEMNRAKKVALMPGGKGINVSLMLHRLGVESVALGFIAGFTGQEIKRRLEESGVRTDFIELLEGSSRINVKLKAEKETELNADGPSITEQDVEALLQKLTILREGDYLVLAGSIPRTLPNTIYERMLEGLLERKIRFVIDAEGELLLRTLRCRPFLVKPNRAELSALCGRTLKTRTEIIEAGRWLQKQGAENVLVSLAGEGAVLIDRDGAIRDRKAVKGSVINSVGAGDSMVAGFLAGFLKYGGYADALRMGMSAGSASAFSDGLASREQVEKLMEEGYAGV